MTVMLELAPEIEQIIKARVTAHGVSLEDYLSLLIAQAAHQGEWEDDASQATIAASEATMRRLWDTPEEDKAWKHL